MASPWEEITSVATVVLAAATIAGGVFALIQVSAIKDQIHDGAATRRVQAFIDLRREFLIIDKDLDAVNRDREYPYNDFCPAWNKLKRYWYFTETEWEISKIDPSPKNNNWMVEQQPRVIHALHQKSFRSVFLAMVKRNFNKDEGVKFTAELNQAFIDEYGKPIPGWGAVPPFPTCTADTRSLTAQSRQPTREDTPEDQCSCKLPEVEP